MALVRWSDPFAGLSSMHSQLDDMVNGFFGGLPQTAHTAAVDTYVEDDKQLVAEVSAPGFTKKDIDVSMHNGMLEIKGEKHEKEEDKGKKRSYMMRESHASFYRSIALPRHADAEKVKAQFKDGVLKVVVPFKELPKPQKVNIDDGGSGAAKKPKK